MFTLATLARTPANDAPLPKGGRRHAVLVALLLCACGDDATGFNDPAGPDTHVEASDRVEMTEHQKPLYAYTIVIDEGHDVTYRAYADGSFVVGERGQLAAASIIDKSAGASPVGPVALFQAINPGKPVPDELRKLEAFMERVGSDHVDDAEAVSIGSGSASERVGAIDKQSMSDADGFLGNFGCFTGQDDVFMACVPNWTGSAFAQANARWAVFKLAPVSESLRFDTTIGGVPRFSNLLNPGDFWVQVQCGPKTKESPAVVHHRIDIFTSGVHHFSARFHNFNTGSANCAELWQHDESWRWGTSKNGTVTTAPLCTSHHGLLR